MRSIAIWTLVSAIIFATNGCVRIDNGRAPQETAKPGSPIVWTSCHRFAYNVESFMPRGAQCGLLTVPMDYANANGEVAELAVIKFPATDAKIGSLVINPGGPGQSGVQAAASIVNRLPDEIRARFDLVGFDPPGVANSTPAVWCNSDADNDRLRLDPQVDYSPKGVEHIEMLEKAFVQRCIDKTGVQLLARIGTATVAKDIDLLRAAIGDEKLTYLGYSYGTRIGATYASAFPNRVRAMVLDGAIDPNSDPIEADIRQAQAFQKVFDDYAMDCAKSSDCALGGDPAKAVDVYHTIVDPLVEESAPSADRRGLSYSDAIAATLLALYSPSMWSPLSQGLNELKNGRGDTMLALADRYLGRDKQGRYTNSTDVRLAVNCLDKPAVTDRAQNVERDRRIREAAPFMSYGRFTGHAPLSTCAFWPLPPTSQSHLTSVEQDAAPLVIATTHDPATPYEAGHELAKQLGGRLLTFDGTQHTVVFQGNDCVDGMAARYLVDVALPPPSARC